MTATAVDHSRMRPEVQALVADGTLPDWDASEEEIDRRDKQLRAISRPVMAEEAQALAACFGPDDCYGVAWTLVHLSRRVLDGCPQWLVPLLTPMTGATRCRGPLLGTARGALSVASATDGASFRPSRATVPP